MSLPRSRRSGATSSGTSPMSASTSCFATTRTSRVPSRFHGQVREERLRLGPGPAARTLGPGEVFDFEAADIHRVLHAGDAPAVTINAYSPPLWRMGSYLVEPGGALRRFSVSYAEELRPLIEVPSAAAA
jgi:hypothetical protein